MLGLLPYPFRAETRYSSRDVWTTYPNRPKAPLRKVVGILPARPSVNKATASQGCGIIDVQDRDGFDGTEYAAA